MNFSLKLTLENLHDFRRYERQIEKMFQKSKTKKGVGSLFEPIEDGVSLFTFGFDRSSLAEALAESVREESYAISPMQLKEIYIPGKKNRIVYLMKPTDKIVLAVLAELLTELFSPFFSPDLYSYRKNYTSIMAAKACANYIRKAESDLWIYQTDIQSYSSNIDCHDNAPIWKAFKHYFHLLGITPSPYQNKLIESAVRPSFYDTNGALQTHIKGTPVGSPISPLVYNIVPYPVDMAISNIPDLFYCRFSDDIIVASKDLQRTSEAKKIINKTLEALNLKTSPEKTFQTYLTPSGKKNPDAHWEGKNTIELLGYSLNGSGTYTLSNKRRRRFLRAIFARITNTIILAKNEPTELLGRLVCQNVNRSFIDETFKINACSHLIAECSDQSILKHLDYLIALKIASSLSKKRGPKAFKDIPYKKLKEDFGLKSLVNLRNYGYSAKLDR